jgi:hypothetical protein
LRPGVTETVVVYEGESAEQISRAFAKKFKLSESIEFHLREQIQLSISKSDLMQSFNRSHQTLNTNISREDIQSSEEDDHPN